MVPSEPTTVELWMSGVVMGGASAGLRFGKVKSIERATVNWRGPVCGLRPEWSGSTWYIGLPPAPPAAAAAGAGAAPAAATGEAAGDAAAAGGTGAGDADAT